MGAKNLNYFNYTWKLTKLTITVSYLKGQWWRIVVCPNDKWQQLRQHIDCCWARMISTVGWPSLSLIDQYIYPIIVWTGRLPSAVIWAQKSRCLRAKCALFQAQIWHGPGQASSYSSSSSLSFYFNNLLLSAVFLSWEHLSYWVILKL